jgi:hypothetical protein
MVENCREFIDLLHVSYGIHNITRTLKVLPLRKPVLYVCLTYPSFIAFPLMHRL